MRTFLRHLTSIAVVASLVACQVTQPEAPSPSLTSRLVEQSTLGPTANLLRPESRADRLRDALTNEVVTNQRILSYSEDAPRELLMSGRFVPDRVTCAPLLFMGNQGEVIGDCSESVALPGTIPSRLPIVAATPVPRPGAGAGEDLLWFTAERYFSPNEDEWKQSTSIDVVALGSLADWTIEVVGQPNGVIFKKSGTHFNLPWDGKLNNKTLPDGWYTLRLRSKTNVQSAQVLIDTQPPVFSKITFVPSSYEPLTNSYQARGTADVYDLGLSGIRNPNVSVTISGLGTDTSDFFFNSGTNTISYSSNVMQIASFAYETLDYTDEVSDSQTDVTLKLEARDLAGNSTTVSTMHYMPLPSASFNSYVKDGGKYVIWPTIALRILQVSINAYNAAVRLSQWAATYLQSLISRGASPEKVAAARAQAQTANVNLSEARNVVYHELYKVELRIAMEKPFVRDPDLAKLVNSLYRENAVIGSGSTAAAIRHELQTGLQVGGKVHLKKGHDYITALYDWLKRHPVARPSDRAAAENIILDLKQSIGI